MRVELEEVISRIIAINHAWKLSREEFGSDFAVTKSLLHTKSSLQATLLREFPDDSYLLPATDNDVHDEELYSVRLRHSMVINDVLRHDAEHLPVRVAAEIFTTEEINNFLNK